MHGVGTAAIGVSSVMSEGGDLGGGAVRFADEDDSEVRPYGEGFLVGKECEDGVWCCARGDVVVLRFETKKEVADASACEIGFMPCYAQSLGNVAGSLVAGIGRHGVRRLGHLSPL